MSIPIITVKLRHEADVMHARQRTRLIAEMLGFDSIDQTRISTAVSEIARNAYQYAGGGQIEFLVDCAAPRQLFEIKVSDQGPGINNIQTILDGRYKSSTTAGFGGIVGAKRLMDHFRLETGQSEGTTVFLGKILPRTAPAVTAQTLSRISEDLHKAQIHLPLEEIWLQNRELLMAMDELRQREEIIRKQATHDELTGLPNRRLYYDRLTSAIAEARRYKKKVGVVFIDLDHFKKINDTLGHEAGDKFLRAVAELFQAQIRGIDTLARLGGDEFALGLPNLEGKDEADLVVRRIFDALEQKITIDETCLQASVSIGIAIFPDDGEDIFVLLKRADTAMYRSKKEGRNTWHYWEPEMDADEQAGHIKGIFSDEKVP